MAYKMIARPTTALLLAMAVTGCGTAGMDPDPTDPDAVSPPTCTPPFVACGTECVDTSSDPDHCGACGETCPPAVECVDGCCQVDCDPLLTLCCGLCTSLDHDSENCGHCGHACPAGEHCEYGQCSGERTSTDGHAPGPDYWHEDRGNLPSYP